ncbi:hypothetical protein BN59_03292 [Legionella massiliensis]|uniref:Mitochondrial carrier protein n=1 Tax=Legionella massiliensis TaxID=1034943 RepID=A0A078L176_9GAMM|nr:hypothetical protein [Legionella massiliensis]CDZ78977.1 hypothetical protein BN59_03292 [Legionella massiliensis]CEE14715.1 hypothetical protein BN1094_03292 [Legionella massiliensis]
MRTKTEPNQSSSNEQDSNLPAESQTSSSTLLMWRALNFTTVAATTSAAIVSIQSPIKTVLVSLSKDGTFFPPFSGGTLGLVRAAYAGTLSSLSSSSLRTLYVTGTKKIRPTATETREIEETVRVNETGYVMAVSFGDILVSQFSESLSQYKKMHGFLPKDFNWKTRHNAYQLMKGGFAPRYLSGLVNFTSLCMVEDRIAESLPIEDPTARHFAAGALSGITAGVFSYPFSAFKDYVLAQSTITEKGELQTKSSFAVLKQAGALIKQNPREMGMTFFKNAAKQLPVRSGLTGTIFATVAGINELLGPEPLGALSERFQPGRDDEEDLRSDLMFTQ